MTQSFERPSQSAPPKAARTAFALVGVAVSMGALSFAAVPFYDWFCRVTGYGGTTSVAAVAPEVDAILDKVIKIRFDANKDAGLPWQFRPLQVEMDIRIGESGLAFYEAYNPTSEPIAGMATYNVTPDVAGGYFTKVHCFCFDAQVLQPGERVEMPVSFYVDPSIVEDIDGRDVEGITLSYTFHLADLPQVQAALSPVSGAAPAAATN